MPETNTARPCPKTELAWWYWLVPLVPLAIWGVFWQTIGNHELFYSLNRWARHWPDGVWGFFVFIGNGWGIFSLLIPLLLLAPRMLLASAMGAVLAGVVSRFIKEGLDLPRPAGVLDRSTFHIIGDTMTSLALPSGHTLTVFAVATAVYFSLPRGHRIAGLWVFGVAILGGVARIAVGAHWPADVLAGAAVGLLGGLAGIALANALPDRLLTPSSWLMRLVALAGAACIYVLATDKLDLALNMPLHALGIIVVASTLFHFVFISFGRRAGR